MYTRPIAAHPRCNRPHRARRSRAKRHLAWEEYDVRTNGIFTWRVKRIAAQCPKLTPNQLRVASLVSADMHSSEIAEILCTSEFAVNKVRCRIRRTLELAHEVQLPAYLSSLLL